MTQHWAELAGCRNDPNPERWFKDPKKHILDLQDICALCPVRKACGNAAMEEEHGEGENTRFGFRAYMTPNQRHAIERLGGLRDRDPMKVMLGIQAKTKNKSGVIETAVGAPIPEEGIILNKAHAALARKLTKWIEAHVVVGSPLPTIARLARLMSCTPVRLRIVLTALTQSGTLSEQRSNSGRAGTRYLRN